MVIGAIVAVCLILLVLAFLAPRLSSGPQRGVDGALEAGRRGGSKAPGRLGRLRDVLVAGDGAIYLATSNRDGRGSARSGDDRIVRVTP